jgi:hypothetical protein
MFETAGTLTIVELTGALVALVLLPLFWAVFAGVAGLRGTNGRITSHVAMAASGGTLGLAVLQAVRAAQSPAGHVAHQHVATLFRIGQLDVSLDLVRDPTSVTCALLAAFLGFAAVLHAVWTAPAGVAGRLAWTGLTTSAVILVALSDGLPTLAVGLQVATVAGWALAGGNKSRALVLALAGDVTVVFAAWVLFWSLGGTFGTSGFSPDPLPRFAMVAVPESPRGDGKAAVSLTTYDDALVTSDDGPPLPGEPLRAPFQLLLDPGVYSFRIQASAATTDLLVTHVTLAAGRSYVLTPYGPTTSLGNLDDQLVVPRPTPAGAASMRTALAARSIGGIRVTSVVGLLVVLAALLRLALLGKTQQGGLVYALEAIPPVVLALHVLPLLDPAAGPAIALVPVIAAVFLAGDAAAARSSDRVPRAALAALSALAMTAVLVGESGGAIVILVAGALGAAAATTSLDAESDVRWLGIACVSLAGIVPGAGASTGIASAITGSFGASGTGRMVGAAVAPLVAVAAMLVATAVFRVYSASIRAPLVQPGPPAPRLLAIALAASSIVLGAIFGVGASTFGGRTMPLARRFVDPPGGLDANPRFAIAALVLSVAAAVIGLVAARRATAMARTPRWVPTLGWPAAVAGRGARAITGVVRFLVRSVLIMNEDVIDDATGAVASVFLAVARGLRLVDAKAASASRALDRGAAEAAVRTGLDHPRRADRVRTGLVLGMVAILGVVVLSSVVLG